MHHSKAIETKADSIDEGEADEALSQPVLLEALPIHHLEHPVVDVHIHQHGHASSGVDPEGIQVQDDLQELSLRPHGVFRQQIGLPLWALHVSPMRQSPRMAVQPRHALTTKKQPTKKPCLP